MNSPVPNSALGRRSHLFRIAVILGLQVLGFAPVAVWCLVSQRPPVEAVCVVTILVAALNAVGVVCLFVTNDQPTRPAALSPPWWIARNGALANA